MANEDDSYYARRARKHAQTTSLLMRVTIAFVIGAVAVTGAIVLLKMLAIGHIE